MAVALAVAIMVPVCLTVGAMPKVQAAQADRSGRDYSQLERQIGIANGLDSYDYTKETWEVLRSAVEAGNKLLEGTSGQKELDKAVQDIKKAIESLVKMDYSVLISTLDIVYAKIDENPEMHDAWYRLDKAVDKARPLLVSGDQQAVDEMAKLLKEIMEELSAFDQVTVEPEVIIQEVEVEVPPSTAFCNIPKHRIWPVLLVASALLNVLLLAALGFVLFRKHKTTDNTPLVNYDIEDDIDFINELD